MVNVIGNELMQKISSKNAPYKKNKQPAKIIFKPHEK